MRRLLRIFTIFAVAGAVLFATTGVALAAAVVHSGVITVAIDDHSPDGVSLYLPVPAALIELGAEALPLFLPDEDMAQIRRELAPHADALRALARELAEMPDATLVAVDTDQEHVRVIKSGRSFEITVDAEDADIRVSVPATSFGRLLNALS